MRVYFDSSALVCLYIPEASSEAVLDFVEAQRRPVLLNPLQHFEMRNSVRQKVARGEIDEGMAARSLRNLDDDIIEGRIQLKPVVWEMAFQHAESLSGRLSLRSPARAIDLLHVAIALMSDVGQFATLDEPQARVAGLAGVQVVDFKR